MKVKDIMTGGCNYCAPTDNVMDVAKLMRQDDYGAVPVAEQDKLVGMLTDRDIVVRGLAEGRDPAVTQVRDLMSENVFYCFDDQECAEVASNMGDMQVRRMPVVDREKQLVGMVSLGDLASHGAASEAATALEGVSRQA